MARIALASYGVRARNIVEHEDALLGDLEGQDLLALFNQYLAERKTALSNDEETQKVLGVLQSSAAGRSVAGLIRSGEYGYERELYDVEEGRTSYRASAEEAMMLPFYFLANLPKSSPRGILLLERFQIYGVSTVLSADFSAWLEERFPEFRVQIEPLIAGEVWRQYLERGRLLSVRLIHYGIPHDLADQVDEGAEETTMDAEYILKARRRQIVPLVGRITEFLEGKRSWENLVQVSQLEYNTVKVQVSFQGSKRTLELSQPESLKAVLDISDEVELEGSGHPRFESIDQIARGYMGDLQSRSGG